MKSKIIKSMEQGARQEVDKRDDQNILLVHHNSKVPGIKPDVEIQTIELDLQRNLARIIKFSFLMKVKVKSC